MPKQKSIASNNARQLVERFRGEARKGLPRAAMLQEFFDRAVSNDCLDALAKLGDEEFIGEVLREL
jgi:hypothetical protein